MNSLQRCSRERQHLTVVKSDTVVVVDVDLTLCVGPMYRGGIV